MDHEARVLVLVGGGPTSSAGLRARQLIRPAISSQSHFTFRTGGRLRSALHYAHEGLRFRPDLIYIVDQVAPASIAAMLLKMRNPRVRIVVDTGDATYALAKSLSQLPALAQLALLLIERLILRLATLIVVRGTYHRLYLRDRGYSNVELIRDLPPSTSPAPAALDAKARHLRSTLKLRNRFLVGLVGSCVWNRRLGTCYGWDVIEALALVTSPMIHAVIIGDGDGIPHLQRRAHDLRLTDRVTFIGRVDAIAVHAHVRLLDVCISTQTDDLVGWVRTTGKLPLYLMHERFVLASQVGEASWLLPPEMLIPYQGSLDKEYPAKLAARLDQLVADRDAMTLARVGPSLIVRHFSPDNAVSSLRHRLDSLC